MLTPGSDLNGRLLSRLFSKYWCWIGSEYVAERLALQYAIIWLNVLVSLVLYTSLYLWGRGHITMSDVGWWRVQLRRSDGVERLDEASGMPPLRRLNHVGYRSRCSTSLSLNLANWTESTSRDRFFKLAIEHEEISSIRFTSK